MGGEYGHTNNLSNEHIQYCGHIYPPSLVLEIGEVTGIEVTWSKGRLSDELVRKDTVPGLLEDP